jgi:hypothetical protein
MATLTLLEFLAHESIAPLTRKGWVTGEYVGLRDAMRKAQALYEAGVVLGYTFRDRFEIFVQLLGESSSLGETLSSLALAAASQLAQVPKEPRDFFDLFFKPELTRLMAVLRDAGKAGCSEWSEFSRVADKKIPRQETLTLFRDSVWKGIGFGYRYPEVTEVLFSRPPSAETWNVVREGLPDLPTTPPPPPDVAERQAEAKALLGPYLERLRPDLLVNLGLWRETADPFQLRWRALLARSQRRP